MIVQKNSKQESSPIKGSTKVKHRKKWEHDQTVRYCQFIQINKATLEQTEKKQKQRIYNKMAMFVGTRTTHQCRSHHQKVIRRYKSIKNFIESFNKRVEQMQQLTGSPHNPTNNNGASQKSPISQKSIPFYLKQPIEYRQPRVQFRPQGYQVPSSIINSSNWQNFNDRYLFQEKRPSHSHYGLPFQGPFSPVIDKIKKSQVSRKKQKIANQNSFIEYVNSSLDQAIKAEFDDHSVHLQMPVFQTYVRGKEYNKTQQIDNKTQKIQLQNNLIRDSNFISKNVVPIFDKITFKKIANGKSAKVNQKLISQTEKKFFFKSKQEEGYRMWFERVKIEEEEVKIQKVDSDSQEIKRELVEELLIKILSSETFYASFFQSIEKLPLLGYFPQEDIVSDWFSRYVAVPNQQNYEISSIVPKLPFPSQYFAQNKTQQQARMLRRLERQAELKKQNYSDFIRQPSYERSQLNKHYGYRNLQKNIQQLQQLFDPQNWNNWNRSYLHPLIRPQLRQGYYPKNSFKIEQKFKPSENFCGPKDGEVVNTRMLNPKTTQRHINYFIQRKTRLDNPKITRPQSQQLVNGNSEKDASHQELQVKSVQLECKVSENQIDDQQIIIQ